VCKLVFSGGMGVAGCALSLASRGARTLQHSGLNYWTRGIPCSSCPINGYSLYPLITHKYSVCVAAKFDNLTSELAQTALASDAENVIGIEMEGSALTAKQSSQRRNDEATSYLMIRASLTTLGLTQLHTRCLHFGQHSPPLNEMSICCLPTQTRRLIGPSSQRSRRSRPCGP
jgi:hypothetical protein